MTTNSLSMRQYFLNIVYYIVFTAIFLVYGSPLFMCVWVLNTNVVHNKFISIRSGTFLNKINLDKCTRPLLCQMYDILRFGKGFKRLENSQGFLWIHFKALVWFLFQLNFSACQSHDGTFYFLKYNCSTGMHVDIFCETTWKNILCHFFSEKKTECSTFLSIYTCSIPWQNRLGVI